MSELIQRYLTETATPEEVAELNRLLATDPALRKQFLREAETDAGLREIALEGLADASDQQALSSPPRIHTWVWPIAAAAALTLLAVWFFVSDGRQAPIATLVSNEDAAWESELPTSPGSSLTPGTLTLKAGMATIEFMSGAEVVLEAPASLTLVTKMKGKLHYGAAVIEAPETAIGFVLETPNGYAVDHGTKFEVSVPDHSEEASFSVISGEISVHHPSGQIVRLTENQASAMTQTGIQRIKRHRDRLGSREPKRSRRLRTRGDATTVIRNNDRQHLSDDHLTLKSSPFEPERDQRALFSFQIPPQFRQSAIAAKIRFYVVPSQTGFAAHLPKRIRFAVFGVTDESRESFSQTSRWEDTPKLEEMMNLGSFEIPRSKQQGVVWFRSDRIVDFVKTDQNGKLSFLLVRETAEDQRHGKVNAFAADSHPDGAGPVLELTFDQPILQ